ncbi:MAG: hypothetical protein ACXQT3_00460 [Methermicoccaceae archaeon]
MRKIGCRLRCPVCGSAEVYEVAGGYVGNIYRCKRCGYSGALVIEANEKLARELEKQYEEREAQREPDM